jgi:hypothetical protein
MEASLRIWESVAVGAVARHAVARPVEVQKGGDDVGGGGGQGGGEGGTGVGLEKGPGVGDQERASPTGLLGDIPGNGGGGISRLSQSCARR